MLRYDVIIVGGGPAGLSAALVLGRCRRRVLVCDSGHPRNAASDGLHGYLSRDRIRPGELLRVGRAEVAAYGVEFRECTVVDADCRSSGPEVTLDSGVVLGARKLLLATGVTDVLPAIDGIGRFYGKSVFHCAYCDGWEMRERKLTVYGDAKSAIGLALALLTWTSDLVICTDTRPVTRRDRQRLREYSLPLRTERIVALEGTAGQLERILFEEGEPLACRGMFFNTGQAQHSALSEKLGCRFDARGHVITGRRGRTGVPNLFLAGDASGEVQFAIVAAAEGASAAVAINQELQEEDRRGLGALSTPAAGPESISAP